MNKSKQLIIRAIITMILSVTLASSVIYFLSNVEETGADSYIDYSMSNGTIVTTNYQEDDSRFTNPERGWYRSYFTDDIWGLDKLESQGISVIQLKADLGDFTESTISDAKLKEILKAFEAAERFGLMVIFRAAYDFAGEVAPEPKDLSVITGHIVQLGKVWAEYEEILLTVQAGFLGSWGEWHSSYYGGIPSYDARKMIITTLLKVVPDDKSIQVRRPVFIRDMIGDDDFSSADIRRIGYHNDALLSTENDLGTYTDPTYSREDELEWVNDNLSSITFAGETVMQSNNTVPAKAINELDKLNASTLNIDHHPEVINEWRSSEYEGSSTFKYLSDNLGYRFVLVEAKAVSVIMQGENMDIVLKLRNDGLGQLLPGRFPELILKNGKTEYVTVADEDPSLWRKESGIIELRFSITVPADAKPGKWSLNLSIPSQYDELRNDPSYYVRFANENVWDDETGHNLLKDLIIVKEADPS